MVDDKILAESYTQVSTGFFSIYFLYPFKEVALIHRSSPFSNMGANKSPTAANISIMIQILAVNITQTEPKRNSTAANKPEPGVDELI